MRLRIRRRAKKELLDIEDDATFFAVVRAILDLGSDALKMHPWSGPSALSLADEIRGPVKQGTLWRVPDELVRVESTGRSECRALESLQSPGGSPSGMLDEHAHRLVAAPIPSLVGESPASAPGSIASVLTLSLTLGPPAHPGKSIGLIQPFRGMR